MKNYRITVNGNIYDVQVEELNSNVSVPVVSAPITSAPVTASTPAASDAPTSASAQTAVGSKGGTKVNAPMPGNILDIKVNVGDKVSANQVVVVLEAMKMENEIVTPAGGTVASINITKGQAVNSGDVLITVSE